MTDGQIKYKGIVLNIKKQRKTKSNGKIEALMNMKNRIINGLQIALVLITAVFSVHSMADSTVKVDGKEDVVVVSDTASDETASDDTSENNTDTPVDTK